MKSCHDAVSRGEDMFAMSLGSATVKSKILANEKCLVCAIRFISSLDSGALRKVLVMLCLGPCLGCLSCCCGKVLRQKSLKQERVYFDPQLEGTVQHHREGRSVSQLDTSHPRSGSMLSSRSSFYMVQAPAYGMVLLLTFPHQSSW